jgi:hypothetical protein
VEPVLYFAEKFEALLAMGKTGKIEKGILEAPVMQATLPFVSHGIRRPGFPVGSSSAGRLVRLSLSDYSCTRL